MAAPPSKTLKDLNGTWVLNKEFSSDVEPALALQGIGWIMRKAVGLSTVTLHVKQFEAPPPPPADASAAPVIHIEIAQTATGGLKGSTEKRYLDYTFREHSDWLFGHVKGKSKWIKAADITDEFLAGGWEESEAENVGPNGESHILNHVESLDNGWTATQTWGFQILGGARMYSRNILVQKGEERKEVRLVYDYFEEA